MTTILIIHHNTYDDLVRLLEALHAQPLRRTLVVDNASHDRRLDLLPTRFPNVEIVALEENLGYAAAVNAGRKRIQDERVLLLNADVVITPTQVSALERIADRLGFPAALGPLHRYEDGTPQLTWGADPTRDTEKRRRRLTRGCRGRDLDAIAEVMTEAVKTRDVDWVSGSCILMDATAPGGDIPWDDEFTLYYEDLDWCRQVRAAGGRVPHTAEVAVTHRHGASMRGASEFAAAAYRRSQIRYASKYHGALTVLGLRAYLTARLFPAMILGRGLTGTTRSLARAQLGAVWSRARRE